MGIFKLPRITTTDRSTLTLGLGELVYDTDLDQVFQGDGATAGGIAISSSSGTGDVVGPASAVNNRVVFFDGTTGKLIKDSGLTLSGSNTGDETTSSIKTKLGAATTSSDGYLTSTDWNTFNNKGLKSGIASGTDTYTVSISGVTSYADGDAYLVRFTNGNTGSSTLNINSLGAKTLYRNNDGALLGGDISSSGEMLCIYNSTLNGFQVIGISPNAIFSYVTNAESVTITKGQVVYAYGGTGDRMTVKLADNTTDATSAQTVGIVLSASIGANQKGLIINQGLLDGLSILPTSSFADGDTIYLDSTAGGITNIKPYAPNHLVYLGVVTTASSGSAGRMYVRVQNGYELDELHNVQAQSPTANDTLYYFGSNQWKTASIPTILGYTPVTNARTISTTSPLSGGGDLSANRTLSIAQATTSASGYLSSTDWNTFNSKEPALTKGNLTESTSSVLTITGGSSSVIGSGVTIQVKQSSSTVSGYLSSTDWSTFNSKEPALTKGNLTESTSSVLTITGGSNAIIGSGLTIEVKQATSSVNGYLSSTDWSTFNNKQSALTFSTGLTNTSGTVTANLSVGVSGGQSVIGGSASGNSLTLTSTSNATKGNIIFGSAGLSVYDEVNDRFGLGITAPTSALHIVKSSGTSLFISSTASGTTAFQANGTTTVTSGTTPHALIQLISSPTANSTAGSRALYMRHSLNAAGINFTNSGPNGPISSFFENRILNVGTITSVTGAIFNGTLMGGDAATCGTITDTVGIRVYGVSSFSNTLTNTITNSRGLYVHQSTKTASQTITNQVGLNVEAFSNATNNTSILLGTTTIPSGNFAIYSAGTETSYFAGSIQLVDKDFILSIGTGTKIGTATGQKLSFWNKTPIIQPTTGLSVTLTFTANSGTAVNDASTFGGYTLKQVVQALINIGILA